MLFAHLGPISTGRGGKHRDHDTAVAERDVTPPPKHPRAATRLDKETIIERIRLDSRLLGLVTDSLDVVAIGIENVSPVVARVIDRAFPWRAVICRSGLERCGVKCVD